MHPMRGDEAAADVFYAAATRRTCSRMRNIDEVKNRLQIILSANLALFAVSSRLTDSRYNTLPESDRFDMTCKER
jgi:hypothetical protein